MAMNRIYQLQSDTDRLYIARMEGGQGLLNIWECVETEEQNLFLNLDHSEKRFSKSKRILPEYEGPVSSAKKHKKIMTQSMEREAAPL